MKTVLKRSNTEGVFIFIKKKRPKSILLFGRFCFKKVSDFKITLVKYEILLIYKTSKINALSKINHFLFSF